MNKQEENIVDILTFDETEYIVDIFIDKLYHSDKTVALIANKELIEYAMTEVLSENFTSVKKVDLEIDNVEYMISVDGEGNTVVQPVVLYNDKYFTGIEYAFVSMDGDVEQMTIDNLINRDIPVVLFGYDDEFDECCGCQKDEKPVTTSASKSEYFINGKSVDKSEFDKKYEEFEEMYMDNIRDMMLNYCSFMDSVNEWRSRLLRW